LWKPLYTLSLPSSDSDAPNAQGLNAFKRLREYRRLHELYWAPPKSLSRNYTEDEIEQLQKQYDQRGGGKKESVYDIIKRDKKKLRQRIVMDQKANSIADLAAVLSHQEAEGQKRYRQILKEKRDDRRKEIREMIAYADQVEQGGLKQIELEETNLMKIMAMKSEDVAANRQAAEHNGAPLPMRRAKAKERLKLLKDRRSNMLFAAESVKAIPAQLAASGPYIEDVKNATVKIQRLVKQLRLEVENPVEAERQARERYFEILAKTEQKSKVEGETQEPEINKPNVFARFFKGSQETQGEVDELATAGDGNAGVQIPADVHGIKNIRALKRLLMSPWDVSLRDGVLKDLPLDEGLEHNIEYLKNELAAGRSVEKHRRELYWIMQPKRRRQEKLAELQRVLGKPMGQESEPLPPSEVHEEAQTIVEVPEEDSNILVKDGWEAAQEETVVMRDSNEPDRILHFLQLRTSKGWEAVRNSKRFWDLDAEQQLRVAEMELESRTGQLDAINEVESHLPDGWQEPAEREFSQEQVELPEPQLGKAEASEPAESPNDLLVKSAPQENVDAVRQAIQDVRTAKQELQTALNFHRKAPMSLRNVEWHKNNEDWRSRIGMMDAKLEAFGHVLAPRGLSVHVERDMDLKIPDAVLFEDDPTLKSLAPADSDIEYFGIRREGVKRSSAEWIEEILRRSEDTAEDGNQDQRSRPSEDMVEDERQAQLSSLHSELEAYTGQITDEEDFSDALASVKIELKTRAYEYQALRRNALSLPHYTKAIRRARKTLRQEGGIVKLVKRFRDYETKIENIFASNIDPEKPASSEEQVQLNSMVAEARVLENVLQAEAGVEPWTREQIVKSLQEAAVKGLPSWHELLPSFPHSNANPYRLHKLDKRRPKILRLNTPIYKMDGVKVQWANILDLEYAQEWPETVEHHHMGVTRYTARKPEYPERMTAYEVKKEYLDRLAIKAEEIQAAEAEEIEQMEPEVMEQETSAEAGRVASAEAAQDEIPETEAELAELYDKRRKAEKKALDQEDAVERKAVVDRLAQELIDGIEKPELLTARARSEMRRKSFEGPMKRRAAQKRAQAMENLVSRGAANDGVANL
jgi:hypothetical protein